MLSIMPVEKSSQLVTYQSHEIPAVWQEVKPLIKRALDRGSNFTIDRVYDGLRTAEMQLWTSYRDGTEAALVTMIRTDKVKYLLFLALGGENMSEWKEWMPTVERWAKAQGCTEMRVYGRIGWARAIGFKVHYTKMSRTLED